MALYDSSAGRTKSYLSKVPTSARRDQKETRKSNVKDSLMKFLDDCGDEDLLMGVASPSPAKKKNNMSLSLSEHGPRSSASSTPSKPLTAAPKRRATKKDHLLGKNNDLPSPSNPMTPTKNSLSLSRSEHGTPSTQKANLSSRNLTSPKPKVDEDSSSDDGSFAADEGGTPLDGAKSSGSRSSSSRKKDLSSSSRSQSKDTSRRSIKSHSSVSSSRIRRQTSENDKHRTHRSESSRKGTRDVRRTKSESAAPMNLGDLFAGAEKASSSGRSRRRNMYDDDNRSVSSSRSSFTTMTASRTGRSLGLDAGPLNAFLNAGERRPSMVGSSAASVGPGISPMDHPQDEEYLRLRKERQEAILDQAKGDRYKAKKESVSTDTTEDVHASLHDGIPDGEDDDQPMVKNKNTVLKRFKKGISKTGKVTKSTAKGTVNVVRDPKRAAMKVGGFAKDVGKETAQMVLNPKLAAKTAVSLGKDVTKGTLKVTQNVGKGVAKGGLGLTKTVAMTGVNATTMVVGTAWDGAGKVVNGATGLIFKHGNGERDEEFADYNASELESRRKSGMSLLDRVSNAAINTSSAPVDDKRRASRMTSQSIPTLLVDNHTKQSWDF